MQELSAVSFVPGSLSSCFLETVRVRLVTMQTVERTDPWCVRMSGGMASFYAVLSGACRIRFDDRDFLSLGSGDLAILLNGRRHWLQSERQETKKSAADSGRRSVICRGLFAWNSSEIGSFLPELPPVMEFKNENGRFVSWMTRFVPVLANDTALRQPGARAAMNQMAYVLFVQSILRVADTPVCIYR